MVPEQVSVDVAPLSAAVSSGRIHLAAAVRCAGIGFLSAEATTSIASFSSEDEEGGTPCDTCDDHGGGDGSSDCEGCHAGMPGDEDAECDANSDHGVRVGLQVCGKKREVDGGGKRTSFCFFFGRGGAWCEPDRRNMFVSRFGGGKGVFVVVVV